MSYHLLSERWRTVTDDAGTIGLVTEGLRKEYAELVAVSGLSMQVHPGEIVGLLGPNGAGKTTALRMIASILTPTSGTATVCGFDTCREPLEAKRRLGFLSGDTALYKRLTPRELLRYFGRLHEMSDSEITKRSEELFEQLDMSSFADRHCGKLSSGQQQKANIARTLLHNPDVLILDEPTNALDIVTGRFMRETLQAAKRNGKAILFSTHHMDTAEYLCDRLFLLHKGEVRASGTLEEVYEHTGKSNLTEGFLELIQENE